jgi:transcriptional regulator with XRE-family HTH domain
MAQSFWWSSYGTFEADESGLYPLACQVVAHYRGLSGLSREIVASYLKIGSKALYYAEYEGRGLDSIARLRELRELLHIPPVLLGLCDAPGPTGWWLADYEPWLTGLDGWPDGRTVIKFYRRAKQWTQSDLAESLGMKLLAVQNMENSGSSLDSLTRRRALRFLLAIPPVLFGLDSEHIAKEFGGTLLGSAKGLAPELITAFRASADALFTGYYVGHAQNQVESTLSWLQEVREVRKTARGGQRSEILEIESLGYEALVSITREYADDPVVFSYANRAVRLARDSGSAEALSVALTRRADTALDRGYVDIAQHSVNEALQLPVQDEHEQVAQVVVSMRILAAGASDEQDRKRVLDLINQAHPTLNGPDMFHRRCNNDLVVIRQSEALNLLAAHAPQVQARDLLRRSSDLLLDLSPELARRALTTKLALAQAYLGLGELDYAVTFAMEMLPLMNQLKSIMYLPQLAQIYQALRKSKLRHDPQVARIGLYLHERGAL